MVSIPQAARAVVVGQSFIGPVMPVLQTPPALPEDFASKWNLDTYTTPIIDSWQFPRAIIPDTGPANKPLTVLNDSSNGVDIARIVAFEHTVSAPDGFGLYSVELPQQLVSDVGERRRLQTATPMDFTTDGAYSLGGWVNANNMPPFITSETKTLISQGADELTWLRVYMVVSHTADGQRTITIEFHTTFATSGSEMVSHTLPTNFEGWFHIWIQQNSTTMELYVDDALVASASPIGASGIGISTNTNFNISGDTNTTGDSIDFVGGLGQIWQHFTRLLFLSEIIAIRDNASNIDFDTGALITDIGDFGSESSFQTPDEWWGSNRKTFTPTTNNNFQLTVKTILRHTPPVEVQFRSINADGNFMVGLQNRSTVSGSIYLGQLSELWGFRFLNRLVYTSGVGTGPSGTAIANNEVITLRITPTASGADLVWLVANIVHDSASIVFDWDTERGLWISLGHRSNASSGSVELLSNPSELAFPLGSGFTYIRAT